LKNKKISKVSVYWIEGSYCTLVGWDSFLVEEVHMRSIGND